MDKSLQTCNPLTLNLVVKKAMWKFCNKCGINNIKLLNMLPEFSLSENIHLDITERQLF